MSVHNVLYEIGQAGQRAKYGLRDNLTLPFGDDKDVTVGWDSANSVLELLPKTDDTGAFNVGDGTTDCDFKVFLGTTAKYGLFDVGNARFELLGAPLYVAGGAAITAIKLGTLSSTTAGSGLTIDATVTRGMEVHVDDNNTARAVGTQGRAIFGRTMIYADNACEDWGVQGLSKVSGVAKTGNVSAGVVGAFESTGVCTTATGSGNTYCAGVMGRLGGGGTFTIGSGTFLSGVLAFYNTSTANAFTNTGTTALHVATTDIASCGKWDYGLYIEGNAAAIGASIGQFAGSAATTSAIPFSSAAVNIVDVHGSSASDLTSDYATKVGRFRHVVNATTANHETYGLMGQLVVKDTTLGHLHAGLIGTFEGHTSGVVCNAGVGGYTLGHAAVMARVGGHAAITATTPLCGFLAWNAGAAALASGTLAAYGVAAASTTYRWARAMYIDDADAVFGFGTGTAYEDGVKIADGVAGDTGSEAKVGFDALMRCYIGATAYYIPMFDADSVTAE